MKIYYSLRMVATILDVSQSTIYRLLNQQNITPRVHKGESYIPKSAAAGLGTNLEMRSIAPYYSIQSAAKLLDVSPRTIRRLINQYNLEIVRVGNRTIRIPESTLEQLIQTERPHDNSIEYYLEQLLA